MKKYLAPILLYAVLLALLPDHEARSTGSLAIPFTIGAQSGPTLSASLLDTNWTTIANYVNAREVSSGTLVARPAAGTAGRWYTATDQNGGATYWDTGSTWQQAGSAVSMTSAYATRGLQGATSTATNTTYNVTADWVFLRNPSSGDVVAQKATTSKSNSLLTSGPAANGRDQSGTFSPPNWIHYYYIWNGSSLDTLSSLCAPSDINGACSTNSGPTMPTGYTHWAYIGAVRMATAGTLNATYARGSRFFPGITETTVVTAVAITAAEKTVDMTQFIPANAASYLLYCSNSSTADVKFGVQTGNYVIQSHIAANAPSITMVELPNVSQQFFWIGSGSSGNETCDLTSYVMPNGG